MSIFDKIKTAIWGDDTNVAPEARPVDRFPSNPTLSTGLAPEVAEMTPTPVVDADKTPVELPQAIDTERVLTSNVDVSAKLDAAAAASGQSLDWRHSIVDLMKALGMDASLQERKELAVELGYPEDMHDTAAMNVFLHRALLKKLAENGGTVPADLLD